MSNSNNFRLIRVDADPEYSINTKHDTMTGPLQPGMMYNATVVILMATDLKAAIRESYDHVLWQEMHYIILNSHGMAMAEMPAGRTEFEQIRG